MQGRMELEAIMDKRTQGLLVDKPTYLKDFYFDMLTVNGYTNMTATNYVYYVVNFLDWLESKGINISEAKLLGVVDKSMIKEYLNFIRYKVDENGIKSEFSGSYRNVRLCAVKTLFNYLIDEGYVNKNPCMHIKIQYTQAQKSVVYMTPKEVEQLKKNIKTNGQLKQLRKGYERWKDRDLAVIHLGLHTGLRVSAISAIDLSDIDLRDAKLTVVEKGNVTRDIYLDNSTIKVLNNWLIDRNYLVSQNPDLIDTDALFLSSRFTRLSAQSIRFMLNKYTYNIDKNITPHKMRSTFATTVYEATGDIYITSKLLGHQSIENTKRYADASESRKRAALDKLDDIY